MTLPSYINPVADFFLLDVFESVTAVLVRENGNPEIGVQYASRSQVDLRRDSYAGVSLSASSRNWSFAKSELSGEDLTRGDFIIDSCGTRWIVEAVSVGSFETIIRATCNLVHENAAE